MLDIIRCKPGEITKSMYVYVSKPLLNLKKCARAREKGLHLPRMFTYFFFFNKCFYFLIILESKLFNCYVTIL